MVKACGDIDTSTFVYFLPHFKTWMHKRPKSIDQTISIKRDFDSQKINQCGNIIGNKIILYFSFTNFSSNNNLYFES